MLHVSHVKYLYLFVIIRINSDYFLKQYNWIVFYDKGTACCLWSRVWILNKM